MNLGISLKNEGLPYKQTRLWPSNTFFESPKESTINLTTTSPWDEPGSIEIFQIRACFQSLSLFHPIIVLSTKIPGKEIDWNFKWTILFRNFHHHLSSEFPTFIRIGNEATDFFLLILEHENFFRFSASSRKTKKNEQNNRFTFREVARVRLAKVPLFHFHQSFGGAFYSLCFSSERKKLNLAASL